MIRWFTMLCISSSLWLSCEKQGRRTEADVESESERGASHSPLAGVSQSRKAHEARGLPPVPTEEDRASEAAKKLWNMIQNDPVAAWRDLESQDISEDDRRAFLGECVTILTERDRNAARDWVANLVSATDRAYAFSRFAVAWAAEDPAAAAEFLKKQGIHEHDDMVAAVQILQQWAQRSGTDATAWALGLPSSLRKSGLEAVCEQWFLHDAPGYGRWLENQQQSDAYVMLLAASCEVLSGQIPEKRRELLQQWPDGLRQQILNSLRPAAD